jgi:PAS domain S-box-containing protein
MALSPRPTRVLLVEDMESDYLLTRRMLASLEGQTFELEWASSWQAGIQAIRRGAFDVCLLDYRIDGGDGLELLKECRQSGCKAPVILLTGVADYRLDVEAMNLGAADFLVKNHLSPAMLERSIRYAIAEWRTQQELRRQHDELRASELRFRSVVQSAGDAIILADDSGHIIFWNEGAEAIFGYSEQEAVGSGLESLMPEKYREQHRAGMERFRMTGKGHLIGKTVELEGLRKDGATFPLELSLASWRTGEGTFFTGIIRDISERKHAEELRCAKEAADAANSAKSNFLARMSHELRTPLHAIIGFTNILLQNKSENLTGQDLDFLERILLNARDQVRLINSILDLSKVEAGHMEVELAPAPVDAIVRDVVKQLEAEKRNPNVEIVVHLPESMEPLVTDAAKLKQVLVNLVHNALKFTERGSVTVEVIASPIDAMPERIDVTDTGAGIPADRLQDIFEPFQQLEMETNRRYGGTGLGLSISRCLCELLGCRLEVQSWPGRGSTFSIVLREVNRLPLTA